MNRTSLQAFCVMCFLSGNICTKLAYVTSFGGSVKSERGVCVCVWWCRERSLNWFVYSHTQIRKYVEMLLFCFVFVNCVYMLHVFYVGFDLLLTLLAQLWLLMQFTLLVCESECLAGDGCYCQKRKRDIIIHIHYVWMNDKKGAAFINFVVIR